ncbi:pentatricopeptide repeat-containing protein At1g31430-like [Neltuma alba]|uniref:pentatricopeptide repeat-containing protein At1g31430-like n=1 Tax=Neltuma alba TaxID=207710 RepID=UPI0010A54A31|nr:pentatricopeptide repeat-containing protein At1g31430-like [Prosopis alba]
MPVYSHTFLLLIKSHKFSTSTHGGKLTKRACIGLLKACKSMFHLKQIQAQMFLAGLHEDLDTLGKLMVICTDSSVGDLHYACRTFNYLHKPSLFIYNLMTKAFVEKSSFREAISLFSQLRKDGLWPDNYTYPFVLKAIGCIGQFNEAVKVHGFIVKTGLELDTYVCNSLMRMYAELGKVDSFEKLFENMSEKDKVSWNIMITSYVKCRRFKDAITIFQRMLEESNEKPDEATVVSTLSACTALKDLDLGKEIHSYVLSEFLLTTIVGNALVDMYCKCGCVSIAQEIFDEVPMKNVICWTSMINGYVTCGQLDEARDLFEKSPTRDIVLWTTMINGYVQFNCFDEAVALFQEMQMRRIKPDKFIVVTLLTGCAQLGALEQGKWIHGYIDGNKVTLDAVVGTALIEMYAKCGCIEKSLEIFYRLRERDTATWTSIVCGLALNGKTSKALELFQEMKKFGARPDDITFIGVLSACSHGGLVEEGHKIFYSMKRTYQIEPKVQHYGCFIDLLGRAGLLHEAEELIKKLPDQKNEMIIPLYGSLLSACRFYGNIEMGERIAQRLGNIEYSDSSLHTLLANIYASADRWEDVSKVRNKMKDLGIKKFPGCSAIEVNGILHEFLVGNPSHPEIGHPEIRDTYSMLDAITKPLFGSEVNEMETEILCLMNS